MLNSWVYILAKNGVHGNIVKSYLELNFIRENTYKKAAVNVSETILIIGVSEVYICS